MELKDFKIGARYKILSCQYGGLGEIFQVGDIGTVTAFLGVMVIMDLDNGKAYIKFAPHDLQPFSSRLTQAEVESDSYALSNLLCDISNFRAQSYESERDCNMADISGFTEKIKRLNYRLVELNTLIRSQKSKNSTPEQKANMTRMIKQLLTNQYISIEKNDTSIVAVTKDITIEYYNLGNEEETHQYKMGCFVITIDLLNGSVLIKREKEDFHLIHPHINSSGKPCWGTYEQLVRKFIAEDSYLELLSLAYDFLSSVYDQGWYDSIYLWHEDADDYCHDCWSHKDDCTCHEDNECIDCGTSLEDCECTRCPMSNERLEDGSFPDRACLGCSHLVKDENNGEWKCIYHTSLGNPNMSNSLDALNADEVPGDHSYVTIPETVS